MNQQANQQAYQRAKTPWHLWVVGGLTLLWNAVGVFSYLMTRLGRLESLGMTGADIAFYESFPAWANGLWAIGVWGAFLGSIFLLLRSRWAVISLGISIIGLVGTTIFQRLMIEIPEKFDSVPLSAAIWVITLLMFWYSVKMKACNALR